MAAPLRIAGGMPSPPTALAQSRELNTMKTSCIEISMVDKEHSGMEVGGEIVVVEFGL